MDWNRLFELYNFNLSTKAKSPIEAKWPFWLWKFRQLARFENGPAPDVTFESASCTECEPEILLSALRFDAREQKWRLRRWSNGEEGIGVGDAAVDVDGSVADYAILSGIADFEHDGNDEVAVWTHYRNVEKEDPQMDPAPVTTLSLYLYHDGQPMEYEIKDETEIARIKKELCHMNSQEAACKNPKPN